MTSSKDSTDSSAAMAQHALLGITPSIHPSEQHTTHPEAQWFPQAGLGLFIHWGISSVEGMCDLSWGMVANTPWDSDRKGKNKLKPDDYFAQAERFDPSAYDPDKWIAAAKAAGFKYAVLTTKHHDGYTLWPTAHGDFGVQQFMDGRDLVQDFIEACRKHDLKVGFYYSPPDWYFDRHVRDWNFSTGKVLNPGEEPSKPYDLSHQPIVKIPQKSEGHEAKRIERIQGQVRELLRNYGRIDLFWFDGGNGEISNEEVRKLQPHIVINSRNGGVGDYDHTECRLPAERPASEWFETCHLWNNGGWGYFRDERYAPTADKIEDLIRLRSWGANLLLNVAPRPNGELPEICYQRFQEMAEWMRHSGVSIFQTTGGPFPERSNIPVTRSGDIWYFHLFSEHSAPVILKAPDSVVVSAELLRNGKAVEVRQENDTLILNVLEEDRTLYPDTVKVVFSNQN